MVDERADRRRWLRAGVVVASLIGVAGVIVLVDQVFERRRSIGLAELRSAPPVGDFVEIACDRITGPVWDEVYRSLLNERRIVGGPIARIVLCEIDGRVVPTKLAADVPTPTKVVSGKLRRLESDLLMSEGVQSDPTIAARSLGLYVNAKSAPWFYLVVGCVMTLFAIAAIVLYVRWSHAATPQRRRA